ncbi:hypothetical protein FPV67DRAFT_113522 [Lyophyllum atratum]|nr:hypothetical protein FPV67DRAFT_113522 [Lyophyllum atratum]
MRTFSSGRIKATGSDAGLPTSRTQESSLSRQDIHLRRNRKLFLDRGLPDDILLAIVEHLSTSDVLYLSQTSKYMYHVMLRPLYESITMRSPDHCRSIVRILMSNPNIPFISNFAVHPSWIAAETGCKSDVLDETKFALQLHDLALTGRFSSLQSFDWAGRDAPDDKLWLALRTCCPQLKNISTMVGVNTYIMKADSQLFEFRNLTSFSLDITPSGLKISPGVIDLPEGLWQMLSCNSPDLLHLSFLSTGWLYRIWNIQRVFSARWRYLKSITLTSLPGWPLSDDEVDLASFLSAHPTLESVRVPDIFSRTVSQLPPLSRLRTFIGQAERLQSSTSELPALECIDLATWYTPSPVIIESLQSLLGAYPTVAAVGVKISSQLLVRSRGDCFRFYEGLVAVCSQLTHIEVTSDIPISLKDFSISLRFTVKLRSFIITRMCTAYRPEHEEQAFSNDHMGNGALRIAKRNPSLEWFTIRDEIDSLLTQLGTYHVVPGVQGTLRRLRVHEISVNEQGERSTRSYTQKLRPWSARRFESNISAKGRWYFLGDS